MRKAFFSSLIATSISWYFAHGQVPIRDQGKPEIMVGPLIHEVDSSNGYFQLKVGYPRLTRGRLMPVSLPLWDGRQVYLAGKNEEGHLNIELSERIFTREGGSAWFWHEPIPLPEGVRVVAAYQERVVLFRPAGPSVGASKKSVGPKICTYDLSEGHEISSLELGPKASDRLSVAIRDGIAYLFLASGELIRIPFSSGIPDLWKENYWKEAGLRLFAKEMADQPNPRLFGKLFFDEEGNILLPVEPMIPMTKQELEEAFVQFPSERQREIIQKGGWPVPQDQDWDCKEWAAFILLDPEKGSIKVLPLDEVHDFITEIKAHITVRRFKNFEENQLYGVRKNKILTFADIHLKPSEGTNPSIKTVLETKNSKAASEKRSRSKSGAQKPNL